ncbi:uncharacterized protein LOC115461769 [Microcaecilia unicolor]|uniref:Uncharacterized protein LOC115461769 n=1 Tax=Microcaecilia unicolor TaxID=1415580 RepID=A0A6P7XBZ4_9AMPH|nr:uncharacterized protein LOC115461769 [Microcaecilia unicolor]
MPGGKRWLGKEVRILLGAVRRFPGFRQLISSSRQRNQDLWREISSELGELGYLRTPDQCRGKWMALKRTFFKAMGNVVLRGQPVDPRFLPHYTKIKSIWERAGRPRFRQRLAPGFINQVTQREPQETSSNRRSEVIVIPSGTDSERDWLAEELPSTSNEQEQRCEDHQDWQRSPTPPEHTVGQETAEASTSPTHPHVKNQFQSHSPPEHGASPAAGARNNLREEAEAADMQGGSVESVLQRILQTMENFATDTSSQMQHISSNLVQMKELLRAHRKNYMA